MRWKIPSSVPNRIASADNPVIFRSRRSAYVSGSNTDLRSSFTQ
jgi:hypothetical protein